MRAAVLLLASAVLCLAAPPQWWQSTDILLFTRDQVSAVMHTQFRMRHGFRDVFQGRVGPVVRVRLPRNWGVLGGYYMGEAESQDEWRNEQRVFGGFDRRLAFERGVLSARTMFEYHFGGPNPSDRRFRQNVQWSHNAPLEPYVLTETFFDRHGYMGQRLQGGMRLQLTRSVMFDAGYVYDIRAIRVGGHRQAIHTTFRPRRRTR